jgi:hypothetical protein
MQFGSPKSRVKSVKKNINTGHNSGGSPLFGGSVAIKNAIINKRKFDGVL